ncbi:hypothetical protein ACLOJK_005612 [Asimina triloba]
MRSFSSDYHKFFVSFQKNLPKKVTNEVLGLANARKSQLLISSIILLKTALEALPLLSKVLKDAKSFLLCDIYKSVCENEKYTGIRKRIEDVIDEDVLHARVPFVARTQQCFAVRAGIDGLLDVARRSFCDTSEAIHSLANKYREEFKMTNLKMPFNNRQGFYFSIPCKDINGTLPKTSLQLKSATCGQNFVYKVVKFRGLIDTIQEDVSALTMLAEVLSVDSIASFMQPNNVFLSEASNLVVVMGPNMYDDLLKFIFFIRNYSEDVLDSVTIKIKMLILTISGSIAFLFL